VARVLVTVLVGAAAAFLLLLSVLIVARPDFPLDIGVVSTKGRAGLLATLLPALAGVAGVVGLWRRRAWGASLLVVFCAFWGAVFLSGLPKVWNSRQSFCLTGLGFCIVSPWVARLTAIGLAAPFLLAAWWTLRRAREGPGAGAS